MTCPSMKRWESTILKINKSATLPYFFFSFACLRHIMAMSIYETSCTPTFSLLAYLWQQEACMPFWRFGSRQNFGESKTILFLDPT